LMNALGLNERLADATAAVPLTVPRLG
jgi:hypothetical protein